MCRVYYEIVSDLIASFGLTLHVHQPTRDENLLDVLATEDPTTIFDLVIDDAGRISDHRLLTAKLRMRRVTRSATSYSFRKIKIIILTYFEAALYHFELFTSPATSVDAFADQLVSIVTRELNVVALLQTKNKRRSKTITKWLSPEAIAAKRKRRRLERRWKRSGLEPDRTAYRQSCRTANRLINESRRTFNSLRINGCNDAKQRWSVIKDVLHSSDPDDSRSEVENQKLCHTFAEFFGSKITTLKHSISSKIQITNCIELFQPIL